MRRWETPDDPSAAQDPPTYQDGSQPFQRPGTDVVAPVWAPRVDITEREAARVIPLLAGSDSSQFGRPLTIVQRVIADAVEAASEGGAPRAADPDGSAPTGAAGQ